MTVELDELGPNIGDDTFKASKYELSVNATSVYVYGHTRTAIYRTRAWEPGTAIEAAWATFGTDELTTASVVLADATPITSVVVMPKHLGVTAIVVGGIAILSSIPVNKRFRIEVNGDVAEPLNLFAEPLAAAVPGTVTNWRTELSQQASVDAAEEELVFSGAHGREVGDRVILNMVTGPWTGGPVEHQEYLVFSVSAPDRLQLADPDDEAFPLAVSDWALTDVLVCPRSYSDAASALYFPSGIYRLGKAFRVEAGCTLYLAYGAIVLGSFDMIDSGQTAVMGPGNIGGTFATYEEALDLPTVARTKYAIFNYYGSATPYADNTIQGVTVFGMPFYMSYAAQWSARNVHVISPWTPNSDAFALTSRSTEDNRSEVVDCFGYVGDDCFHVSPGPTRLVQGSFAVNSAAGSFLGGYSCTVQPNGLEATIIDCDVVHLGVEPEGATHPNSGVFRCWVDGYAWQWAWGTFDRHFSQIRVWGPLHTYLGTWENRLYPWGDGGGPARARFGQIAGWTFTEITVEETPLLRSTMIGLDEINTPHDIEWVDLSIGGVSVVDANAADYFQLNAFVRDVTWTSTAVPPDPEPEPEPNPDDIAAALLDSPDIASYTTPDGMQVSRRSVQDLIRLEQYQAGKAARARGLRRTRARFTQ